jgi:hypothetical protein
MVGGLGKGLSSQVIPVGINAYWRFRGLSDNLLIRRRLLEAHPPAAAESLFSPA